MFPSVSEKLPYLSKGWRKIQNFFFFFLALFPGNLGVNSSSASWGEEVPSEQRGGPFTMNSLGKIWAWRELQALPNTDSCIPKHLTILSLSFLEFKMWALVFPIAQFCQTTFNDVLFLTLQIALQCDLEISLFRRYCFTLWVQPCDLFWPIACSRHLQVSGLALRGLVASAYSFGLSQ